MIDLRARFALSENELTEDSRITVLDVGRRTIGIVVDPVNEVLRVSQEQISPAPPTVASLGNQYMTGLVRLGRAIADPPGRGSALQRRSDRGAGPGHGRHLEGQRTL